MRRLDHEIREEEPAVQAHLLQLMDRYVTWFDRLPDADKDAIRSAADANDRLAVIRQIREREWEEHLPRARREQLAAADPERRPALLAEWREQEARRRKEWDRALGGGQEEPPQHRRPRCQYAPKCRHPKTTWSTPPGCFPLWRWPSRGRRRRQRSDNAQPRDR